MKRFLIILIAASTILMLFYMLYQHRSEKYEKALESYHKGHLEKDTFLKNQHFNQALETLLTLKGSSSSKNSFIALILAQLRQFPLSAYYYLEALAEDPDNPEIYAQLNDVIKMGNLPMKVPQNLFKKSYPLLFALFFIFWIALLACWIWNKNPLVKLSVVLTAIPLFAYLSYIIYLGFFAHLYGVIIHPQTLYQEAGQETPPVSSVPVAEGTLVTVLDTSKKGHWLKIRTEEGVMGFVPQDAIRVLH